MAVLRKNKVSNYTVIDNNIFKNRNLSIKARGMLCTMLSLPDNWEYSLNGLSAILPDGITTIRSALKELAEHGYFERYRTYEDGKLAGVVYVVSETPMDGTFENLNLENLKKENLKQENQPQLNTNTNKVKKESNKDIYNEVPDYLMECFKEWADMRKSIKRPITSKQTVTRALNKLYGLAKDHEEQVKLVQAATDKCWLSFYPVNKQSEPRSRTNVYNPEPPKYKQFEREPEIDAVQMPDKIRKKMKGFISEL